MGFTENSRLQDMQEAVTPYRAMAASFEVETRLDEINTTLLLAGRTLMTSNDRLQMSAAYLMLARNQYLLTDNMYESVGKMQGDDVKAPQFSYKALGGSLISGFQAVKAHLEAADKVSETMDFTADPSWMDHLKMSAAWQTWLPGTHLSGRYVRGAIRGLEQVAAYTYVGADKIEADTDVSNMFKMKISAGTQPLRKTVDSSRRGIARMTQGSFTGNEPLPVTEQAMTSVQEAALALNGISIWITMPRYFDKSLTPAQPLDETGRGKRSFDARSAGIARNTPTQIVPARQAPTHSAKPFKPDAVAPPAQPVKKVSARPFGPDALQRPEPVQAPVTVKRPSARPFSPDAVVVHAAPTPPTNTLREFDPSHITPDTDD